MSAPLLLTRDEFRACVMQRSAHTCVICSEPAVDAHHVMERRLWTEPGEEGGYFIDNGAAVCERCHKLAERNAPGYLPSDVRRAAGITRVVLPFILSDADGIEFDKWGHPVGTGELVKYPRTPHLPYSCSVGRDDRQWEDTRTLDGREVVITVKLDGENTTMYRDSFHARSLTGASHPSQSYARGFWRHIAHDIPEGWRVCCENVYAHHAVKYASLPAYVFMLSVWDHENRCLPWGETEEWAALFGMPTVPVLWTGYWSSSQPWTVVHAGCMDAVRTWGGADDGEGYVMRLANGFPYHSFTRSVAKFVRPGLVPGTNAHWRSKPVVPNGLARIAVHT